MAHYCKKFFLFCSVNTGYFFLHISLSLSLTLIRTHGHKCLYKNAKYKTDVNIKRLLKSMCMIFQIYLSFSDIRCILVRFLQNDLHKWVTCDCYNHVYNSTRRASRPFYSFFFGYTPVKHSRISSTVLLRNIVPRFTPKNLIIVNWYGVSTDALRNEYGLLRTYTDRVEKR